MNCLKLAQCDVIFYNGALNLAATLEYLQLIESDLLTNLLKAV